MKKIFPYLFLFSLVFAGCRDSDHKSNSKTEANLSIAKPIVYVSNYPLYYFTERIGGGHIELRFPAARLDDPSQWSPPADTVAAMQQADLILLNGASFESWLMNVSLGDSLVVDTSKAYTLQLLPSGQTFTHSHGEEGAHEHEGTASNTWMDLSLATQQAEAVYQALARQKPDNAANFKANFEALAQELVTLDREFKKLANDNTQINPIFAEPAFQYFSRAYNIKGPSLNWESGASLTQDKVHELGHLLGEKTPRVLIWSHEVPDSTIAQTGQRGLQSIVVHTMVSQPENGNFLSGMRSNLKALKSLSPGD